MIPSRTTSVPWSTIMPVIGETNLGAIGFLQGFWTWLALISDFRPPVSSDMTTVFSCRISPGCSCTIFSYSSILWDWKKKDIFLIDERTTHDVYTRVANILITINAIRPERGLLLSRSDNTDVFRVLTCTTGGAPFSETECSELCTVVFVQTPLGSCPDCDKVEVMLDDTNSFVVDVFEECVTVDDILVSTWLSPPPSWYVFSLEKCFSLLLAGCMISAGGLGTSSSTLSTSCTPCFTDSVSESSHSCEIRWR